jgi:hypothetical protein
LRDDIPLLCVGGAHLRRSAVSLIPLCTESARYQKDSPFGLLGTLAMILPNRQEIYDTARFCGSAAEINNVPSSACLPIKGNAPLRHGTSPLRCVKGFPSRTPLIRIACFLHRRECLSAPPNAVRRHFDCTRVLASRSPTIALCAQWHAMWLLNTSVQDHLRSSMEWKSAHGAV